MRHRWGYRKLGRTSAHRRALLRNLVTELLDKEKIVTTVPKAKELRSFAERMITLGKKENLHARRRALSVIRKKAVVHKLFDSLGPRFADRNGGYTRIVRLGNRRGDNAEVAILELVESTSGSETKAPDKGKKGAKKEKSKPKAAAAQKRKSTSKKQESAS